MTKAEKQNKMGLTRFGRTQNTSLQNFFLLQATLDTNTNQWQKENDPKNLYTLPADWWQLRRSQLLPVPLISSDPLLGV